jgi:hypothetical protein
MTAKEYLNKPRDMRRKIMRDRARYLEYKEMAVSTGGMAYDQDRVQSSPSGGMAKVDRLIDLGIDLDEEIDAYRKLCDRIQGQIEALEDQDHIDVLFYRYLQGDSWSSIADRLHLSERSVFNKHGDALQAFGAKFLQDYRGQ